MLSPDGQTLLTDFACGRGQALRLWDTATGEPRCGPIELPQAVDSRAASTADGSVGTSTQPGPPMGNACTSPTPARRSASWTSRPAR